MDILKELRDKFQEMQGVKEYTYRKGEEIVFSDEKVEKIYLVIEGEIDINYVAKNGNIMHLLIARKGELLGAVDLSVGNWMVNMTAKTMVKLLGIDKEALSTLDDNALFWKSMYLDVSKKFKEFGERIFTKSTAVSYENYFLLYLKENGYQIEFNSLADLAYCLNLEYRNFFRVIKKLVEAGIIIKEKNRIYVPSIETFNSYLKERL
jgi:CRP-like cAMP-binding protein